VSHLRGLRPQDLRALWPDLPLDDRLARRIQARLIWRDADDLEGVPGLSRVAAREVMRRGQVTRLEVVERQSSQVDPFVKYLFRAADGQVFEAVRIPLERPRWSVCVSSQVGCALACVFCETGRLGFTRILEPGRWWSRCSRSAAKGRSVRSRAWCSRARASPSRTTTT
jgi:23S rRNA (adenine2503-C2)-methyltransferase